LTLDENNKNKQTIIEDPMIRSGFVLTSANASLMSGNDVGIVSSNKIIELDLKDTDLVVLSACNTGAGNIEKGDSVYGLKKAFALSGAKSLIVSLWSVPSIETTELMTQFYTLLSEGKNKSEALREAKLNIMKKKKNPFYWGAFIISGNSN
jgi:CHAT domain-containing protein